MFFMKEFFNPLEIVVHVSPETKVSHDKLSEMTYDDELKKFLNYLILQGVLDPIPERFILFLEDDGNEDGLPEDLYSIDESGVTINYPFIEIDNVYYQMKFINNC